MPDPQNRRVRAFGRKNSAPIDTKNRRESLSFLLAGKRGGGKIAPRLVSRSPAMRVSQSVFEVFHFAEHRG